jgi:hypothetical protein
LGAVPLKKAASPDIAGVLFGGERSLPLLRAYWPLAVGPRLAQRTQVVGLEAQCLIVRVPDARWRKILHRLRREILQRLREVAGARAPRTLGFALAPLAQPEPAAPAPAPKQPSADVPLPREVVSSADAIADPEMRALFLRSAGLYLARGRRR